MHRFVQSYIQIIRIGHYTLYVRMYFITYALCNICLSYFLLASFKQGSWTLSNPLSTNKSRLVFNNCTLLTSCTWTSVGHKTHQNVFSGPRIPQDSSDPLLQPKTIANYIFRSKSLLSRDILLNKLKKKLISSHHIWHTHKRGGKCKKSSKLIKYVNLWIFTEKY